MATTSPSSGTSSSSTLTMRPARARRVVSFLGGKRPDDARDATRLASPREKERKIRGVVERERRRVRPRRLFAGERRALERDSLLRPFDINILRYFGDFKKKFSKKRDVPNFVTPLSMIHPELTRNRRFCAFFARKRGTRRRGPDAVSPGLPRTCGGSVGNSVGSSVGDWSRRVSGGPAVIDSNSRE